jgi:hypothetical protein
VSSRVCGVLAQCGGVRDWRLLFPLIAAISVASGRAGQGPGGARPPGAAPEASLRRLAGSPMIRAAGEREPGVVQVFGCSGPSHVPVLSDAGSAAGCSHPFACPRPWPGGMGRVRVRAGGQAGSVSIPTSTRASSGSASPSWSPTRARAIRLVREPCLLVVLDSALMRHFPRFSTYAVTPGQFDNTCSVR